MIRCRSVSRGKPSRAAPAALLALLAMAACKEENRYEAPPLAKIAVATPVARKITLYLDTTGSVEAIDTVDLMARVQGFLQDVSYRDGMPVKKGDTLFTIEPLPYQAKLQQAQAAEQGAQAQLLQTSTEYDRQSELGRRNVSPQTTVDQALANRDVARSNYDQARANTQMAAINYAYTRVTAPFGGIVSAHLASVGELVGGSQPTKLATIVRLDPIWVSFTVSEQDVLRIREMLSARHLRLEDLGAVPVEVGLQTESGTPHSGTLDYVNPGIDPANGTLSVRAVFANADRALLPGNFVRVRIPEQRDVDALLVPDAALGNNQAGRYVLVVGPDNVVAQRQVETGPVEAGLRVISSGLAPDDRVVVNGLQRAIPGDKVDPQIRTAEAR